MCVNRSVRRLLLCCTQYGAARSATTFALILISACLLLGIGSAQAQDQGARQSPPYDSAQVTVPTAAPLALVGQPIYQENCAPCHGVQGMGDGPTAADLPSPPTAFADAAAVWERSPAQLFHTTKFGRLEKLMPPWQNQLTDEQIWQAVAYAWSLHTTQADVEAGKALYLESCAACHGQQGQGDGPDADGTLVDFTDQQSVIFRSQADWTAGWQNAHPDIGDQWTVNEQANTLEYVRTFSYWPPWESSYQPGSGVISGGVVQGTAGETAPANLPIVLEAYIGFEPIAAFTSTVAADGSFVFNDLAIDPNINYLATVAANGISYTSNFLTLSPITPTLTSDVSIFATTDDPAGVRINRAHWIVDQQPGAIMGGAIYIFGNSGDRTFIGQTVEGVEQPVTLAMQLPPGAVEVALDGGTLGERFFQVGDTIYDTLPLLPGENTRQTVIRYAVPFEGDTAELQQQFFYPVDQLTLLVASLPGLQVDAAALEATGPQNMGGQEYQLYRKADFASQTIDVKLAGLLPAGSADPRAGAATDAATQNSGGTTDGGMSTTAPPLGDWVTWVMLGLVAALLLAAFGVALQRGALSNHYSRQSLADLRETLLQQMAHLDDLHAMGEISQAEWMRQRSYLKAQLVDVMQRLDPNTASRNAIRDHAHAEGGHNA